MLEKSLTFEGWEEWCGLNNQKHGLAFLTADIFKRQFQQKRHEGYTPVCDFEAGSQASIPSQPAEHRRYGRDCWWD